LEDIFAQTVETKTALASMMNIVTEMINFDEVCQWDIPAKFVFLREDAERRRQQMQSANKWPFD
jgi:cell division FtsZ-interacting protein ZapD